MIGKEVRVVTRDAAQWSQLFMMVALLFIYLYNIEMMPLEGDIRAALLAYLNLGMAGFVIAAICLRFAYPSISAEGKQFWILASAPISYRRLLWVKVLVYAVPLVGLSVILTAMANFILDAALPIWQYTLAGGVLIAVTLVCLGVGLGGMAPDFKLENPMEAALSLGGFGYLAISMLYIGGMMFLLARPLQRFIARIVFGAEAETLAVTAAPIAAAVGLSVVLCIIPMELARRTLDKLREN
jgi:ABC-2 type transport system permease protein